VKIAPTLIDSLYRSTFRNEPILGFKSNAELRERLTGARRFMLSEPMSGFLGELASRAFMPTKRKPGTSDAEFYALMARQVDSMRVGARAPHRTVWIEYDLRAAQTRSKALLDQKFDPSESPEVEGWLIEQHPQMETAFRLHIFTWNKDPREADEHGFGLWSLPHVYTWTVDDSQTPWPSVLTLDGTQDAGVATGILTYTTRSVTVAQSDLMLPMQRFPNKIVCELMREWVGVVRRAWALLATLNDLPLVYSDVRQSKGFVAKGRYRRFLDHRTITINVPQKAQTKLAKQLIALIRRRAHEVRGHWRDDWRHAPSARCEHLWVAAIDSTEGRYCERCHGHQSWVHEHQRGDASLGFVTHNYAVNHEDVS